jgi:hypothetical protein
MKIPTHGMKKLLVVVFVGNGQQLKRMVLYLDHLLKVGVGVLSGIWKNLHRRQVSLRSSISHIYYSCVHSCNLQVYTSPFF